MRTPTTTSSRLLGGRLQAAVLACLTVALVATALAAPAGGAASKGSKPRTVVISKDGGLGRVELAGKVGAVLGRDEGIVTLLDTKSPSSPKPLGSYDDGAEDSLDGDLAFSTDGSHLFYARQTKNFSKDGLHVLDVSDPSAPALAAYHPMGGSFRVAYHQDDAGEWVYVLDAIHGLVTFRFEASTGQVVPVGIDALPALKVGGPASAGIFIDPKDPITKAPLMYVTTGRTGLQVFDIANAAAPELVGKWNEVDLAEVEVRTDKRSRTVFAATEYWFDANLDPEIVVLDATDLTKITQKDTFSAGGKPDPEDRERVQGMAFGPKGLYVAHSTLGVIVFDMKGKVVQRIKLPKGAPGPKAETLGSPHAMDVEIAKNVMYVTDAASGQLSVFKP